MLGHAPTQKVSLARSLMLASMFVLFLPFGVLVGLGWLIPKAIQLLGPMKEVIS